MPLIQSPSKKALQKNIKTEIEVHPSKGKRSQDLAIAFSVQRKNKRKKYADGGEVSNKKENYDEAPSMDQIKERTTAQLKTVKPSPTPSKFAKGGKIYSKDEEHTFPKKNPKLGDEYEGDNEPSLKAGATGKYMKPSDKDFMGKDWAGGEMGDTPEDSDEDAIAKKDYSSDRYAKGGTVGAGHYGKKSEEDGAEHPAGLESDNDQMRPDKNDYLGNDWAGGPDLDGPMNDSSKGPSEKEYMANHMQMLADGGHVACTNCGGMGYADGGEIHDGVDESHDIDADEDGGGSIAEQIMKKKIMTPTYKGNPYESEDEWNAEGKKYAEGGEITDHDEEGPGTDRSTNIKAKKFFQEHGEEGMGDDPKDSNEHGDDHEAELENKLDMIEAIRRKMKASRG